MVPDHRFETNFTVDAIDEVAFSQFTPYFLLANKALKQIFVYNPDLQFFERTIEAFYHIQIIRYLPGTDFAVVSSDRGQTAFLRMYNQGLYRTPLMGRNAIEGVKLIGFDFKYGHRYDTPALDLETGMFLWIYVSKGYLILSSPQICWNECRECDDGKMFYSAVKKCSKCRGGLQKRSTDSDNFWTSTEIRSCYIACKDEKNIPNFFSAYYPNTSHVPYYPSHGHDRHNYCMKPYKVTDKELELNIPNKDKCQPDHTKNDIGVCTRCTNNFYKNCDLCYHNVITGFNCIYLNLYNYTVDYQNHKFWSKNDRVITFIQSYYYRLSSDTDWLPGALGDIIPKLQRYRLRDCAKYQKDPRVPFKFNLAPKRGFKVSFKRTSTSEDNFLEFEYSCFKFCETGFYYSNQSMMCRRCPIGCSICENGRTCSLCQAGWSHIFEEPESNKLIKFSKFLSILHLFKTQESL